MIVTAAQIQSTERLLFDSGTDPESLMEPAGLAMAKAIAQFFPKPGHAVLFCGGGHNAGDALVAGRHLRAWGWRVTPRLAVDDSKFAPLTAKKWRELQELPEAPAAPISDAAPLVLVDGLLGVGARGPLRTPIDASAREMNALREIEGGFSVAVDLPTGVDPDTGQIQDGAVVADLTLTVSHVKAGLLEDGALDHVGRLALIPLNEIQPAKGDASRVLLEARHLRSALVRPPFSLHKGAAGRVGIVAGSRLYSGAAALAATGALRGGGGLVTVCCPEEAHGLVAARTPPEIMVRPLSDLREVMDLDFDAIGIGPGLTLEPSAAVLDIVAKDPRPLVVDADALNTLAASHVLASTLQNAPAARLLTPHPGEIARLDPELAARPSRLETARAFAGRYATTLLYKGSRTLIAHPDHPVAYNSTGSPGMATGGMGDLLTGLCTALAARGLPLYQAACAGSWLCGHAAELALAEGTWASEGLSPSDVALQLPRALNNLRRGVY